MVTVLFSFKARNDHRALFSERRPSVGSVYVGTNGLSVDVYLFSFINSKDR